MRLAGRPSPPTPPSLLGLFGPTASGKTAVAEAIARRLPGELVSADSMQAYRGLPILTNQGPGRLVGIWPLDRQGSVGEFQELAHAAIDEILAAGRTPIVVGGSGLWFRAALADIGLPPNVEPGARSRFERLYERFGAATAHALLAARDPRAAAQVHQNDRKRVVRALELWQAGASLAPDEPRLWGDELRHPTLVVGLDVPAEVLDARIRARTRAMFERGVVDEVRAAGTVVPLVLGLEAVATLPPAQAAEEIVRATLRLASYQRKWMRRIPGIVMIDGQGTPDKVADAILQVARAR